MTVRKVPRTPRTVMLCFFFLLPEHPVCKKVLEYPHTVTRNLYTFTRT